eukprot:scaffold23372_cov66-Phaeocystis_antarctica.AAC.2
MAAPAQAGAWDFGGVPQLKAASIIAEASFPVHSRGAQDFYAFGSLASQRYALAYLTTPLAPAAHLCDRAKSGRATPRTRRCWASRAKRNECAPQAAPPPGLTWASRAEPGSSLARHGQGVRHAAWPMAARVAAARATAARVAAARATAARVAAVRAAAARRAARTVARTATLAVARTATRAAARAVAHTAAAAQRRPAGRSRASLRR